MGKNRIIRPNTTGHHMAIYWTLTVLVSVWILVGCAPTPVPLEPSGPVESAPSNTSTPITVQLLLSKAPKLGEPADLTFTVSSVDDAPGTIATILLPAGAVLLEGDLEWKGDLSANQPWTRQVRIQFEQEGNWTIEGKALRDLGNGDAWGDAAHIYLHVTQDAGQVGFSPDARSQSGERDAPPPPPVNAQD